MPLQAGEMATLFTCEEQMTVATFASMELYETGSSNDPWLALHS